MTSADCPPLGLIRDMKFQESVGEEKSILPTLPPYSCRRPGYKLKKTRTKQSKTLKEITLINMKKIFPGMMILPFVQTLTHTRIVK